MNKDPVEALFKSAFDNATPIHHEDTLRGVREKMKTEPRRFRKRFLIILAACFLLFTTVVAAQAIYRNWGDFDWLTGRLGNDAAQNLQPIGLGLTYVRADAIYSMESITEEGVRIELIAVGANDSELDVYVLLEDLTETRVWGEEIAVGMVLRFTDLALSPIGHGWAGMGRTIEFNEIERDDIARKVVLHSRVAHPSLPHDMEIPEGANTRDLTLFIDAIMFSHSIYEEVEVAINLAELLEQPSPTHIITLVESREIGGWGPFNNAEAGDVMLVPRSLSFPFEAEGHPMQISAIAVVDGKLHLQLYGGGSVLGMHSLVRNGEVAPAVHGISFRYTPEGRITSIREWDDYGNWLWLGEIQYWELVFDVDLDYLHEYQLVFNFLVAFDSLTLNRAVSFELQQDVAIPRQLEWHVQHEAQMDKIFGDLPREVSIFDNDGNFMGTLYAITSRIQFNSRDPVNSISNVQMSVYFTPAEGRDFDRFPAGQSLPCIREYDDHIPPELRDTIMYYAERWFALEDKF
ncbi:MAG: hypothetical protein FWC89_11630 [Defluviitaleaceae bacterium]|nr:hypothetical protein [Defluviitaleaceae bacterium]